MFKISDLVENKGFRKWVLKKPHLENEYWSNIYYGANTKEKKIIDEAIHNVKFIYSININKNIIRESDKKIEESFANILALSNSKSNIFSISNILKYSAAAILILSIGIFSSNYFSQTRSFFDGHLMAANYNTKTVVIETEDGHFFKVPDKHTTWELNNGVNIEIDKSTIKFVNNNIDSDINAKFIIHVPRLQRYKLAMIDGTVVDINSFSTLEFSVDNNSDKRVVKLNGEAYFEVAKNKERPFQVLSNDMEIEVLGTKFNVLTNRKEVFLLEGSVKVSSKKENKIIKPGDVAKISNNKIIISKRKVNKSMLWTSDVMLLEDTDLTDILSLLEQWYYVKFSYDEELISRNTFSGKIYKKTGLTANLEKLNFSKKIKHKVRGKIIELKYKE